MTKPARRSNHPEPDTSWTVPACAKDGSWNGHLVEKRRKGTLVHLVRTDDHAIVFRANRNPADKESEALDKPDAVIEIYLIDLSGAVKEFSKRERETPDISEVIGHLPKLVSFGAEQIQLAAEIMNQLYVRIKDRTQPGAKPVLVLDKALEGKIEIHFADLTGKDGARSFDTTVAVLKDAYEAVLRQNQRLKVSIEPPDMGSTRASGR